MSDSEIDGAAVVAAHWSVAAPHTTASITAAAQAIEEPARYLAHTTRADTGRVVLPQPGDGYTFLGHLVPAARSLTQVLTQPVSWSDALKTLDLRHDNPATRDSSDPTDAHRAVDTAAGHLTEAAAEAHAVVDRFDRAHAQLAHLFHDPRTLGA